MIKLICKNCGKVFLAYPSRLSFKKFCSRECYSPTRNKMLEISGKSVRFQKGHIPSKNRKMPKGINHKFWKGEMVGYRGLHYWLRRVKGQPLKCEHCGRIHKKPRDMDWANIDNQYHRNSEDYISLCKSCHKLYDLKTNPMSILGL